MAEKKKYNSILVSGRKDETLTYSRYVKDEESGESVKESLDKKINVTDELETHQIKDGAITNEKMAADSVNTEQVIDESIVNSKLANDSVSTEKIENGSVTNDKMAADSVGNTNLQDGSVSNEKLENGSITNEKLAEKSITKYKLKDNTSGVEKLDPQLRETIKAATGVPGDLANDITKLMRKVFPLEVTVNITPNALQEKGTSTEITINWSAKVEGEIVTPDSVFVNGHDFTEQTSYKETVSDSKNFNVEVKAEGRVTSVTKNITYVYPIFTGFNSATTFTESLVESLTKLGLRVSLGTITDTKTNNSTSNYYWIVSPYKVNNVVTSGISIINDFIYTTVEYKGTTYHCYRLNSPSSADTFTFIIS